MPPEETELLENLAPEDAEPTESVTPGEEDQEEEPTEEATTEEPVEEDSDGEPVEEEPEKDPVQKRIDKLVAQKKELQERLADADREREELRQQVKLDKQEYEQLVDEARSSIPNPIMIGNKPAYLATDEEFAEIEDRILEGKDPAFLDSLKQAKKERREYLKAIMPLNEQYANAMKDQSKLWQDEWKQVQEAFLEISPKYAEYIPDLEERLQKDIKANKAKLERLLLGGVREKFRYIDRLTEELGIKAKIEQELNRLDRPNLAAPVGAGKGKRTTPTGQRKPAFTREQIEKMSPAEYDRLEKEIDRALAEGRIK